MCGSSDKKGNIQIILILELCFILMIVLSGINIIFSASKTFDEFLNQQKSFYLADGGIEIGNKILNECIKKIEDDEIKNILESTHDLSDNEIRYKIYNDLKKMIIDSEDIFEDMKIDNIEIKIEIENIYTGREYVMLKIISQSSKEECIVSIIQSWRYEYPKLIVSSQESKVLNGILLKQQWVRRY